MYLKKWGCWWWISSRSGWLLELLRELTTWTGYSWQRGEHNYRWPYKGHDQGESNFQSSLCCRVLSFELLHIWGERTASIPNRAWRSLGQGKLSTRQSKHCGFSIYIFDNSKSMVRLVRAERMVLSGLVFARKIARMILIQNIQGLLGPLMINMAFMPLYMWEMWDVTPVTHGHTDGRTNSGK